MLTPVYLALGMIGSPPLPPAAKPGLDYVEGEILVKFASEATLASKRWALIASSAVAGEPIATAAMRTSRYSGLILAKVNLPVPVAIERLRQMGGVEFAEPNWIYRHTASSNDPYYTNGSLWGMYGDATSPAN
ncbi:MAG: peptidase S8, partial [Nitrospirae bacterium]|nr:peptidase S8 [Fimbriimonadaceae bacterium]